MSSQAQRMYSKDSLSLTSYFLQDWFSVLLEYDDVSERSFLTNILCNGGSFYNSSHAHTMCSQQLSITCYGQQHFSFTDLIILKLLVTYFSSCKLLLPYFMFLQSQLRMRNHCNVAGRRRQSTNCRVCWKQQPWRGHQPDEYGTDKNILETLP